jgi:outer membrane lipoprotein SlyB
VFKLVKEIMKSTLFTLALASSIALFSQASEAKGCLKGAAVGGVAGHVAGGHGLLGAAAGCAIGRHEANKKAKQAAAQSSVVQEPRK